MPEVTAPKRRIRILAIEDDPGDAELLRRHLGQCADWDVALTQCATVQAAREALPQPFDLVFVDFRLGALSGIDLLREALAADPHRPVVMLTGQGNETVAVEAMKAGATDYLSKGHLNPEQLHRAMAHALETAALRRQVEQQRLALIEAERQRVMVESLGAACHHLAQPLTAMLGNLQLLQLGPAIEEARRQRILTQALEATLMMSDILRRLQAVTEYRTVPYVADQKILDVGIGQDAPESSPPASE